MATKATESVTPVEPSSAEEALVLRLLAEVARNPATIDELCTEDVVRHLPMDFENDGRAAFRAAEEEMLGGLTGTTVTPTHVLSAGNLVAVRFVMRAKHTGTVSGFAATGRDIETTGQVIARVEGTRIAEIWEEFDFYRFMQQLR